MKKILIRGPVLTRSGYGEHVRFILRALRQLEDKLDIYLIPVNWGNTGWIYDDDEERIWIDSLINKTAALKHNAALSQEPPNFDLSIQVSIPNEWEKLAPINIGVTAGIETTKVAPQWVEKGNMVDLIIVPSHHSKHVYENTNYNMTVQQTGQVVPNYKCTTPIEVLSYPVKDFSVCDLGIDFETDFNFLNIAQWSSRKDVENCIKWFVEEFIDQEVGLILKLNIAKNCLMDRRMSESKIKFLLSDEKYTDRKCKIYLLHGDMTDQEIHQLYRHSKIKAFVTTTHGEGFGLPMFEAAYEGMPLIAPDWSGYMDFLYMPVADKKGKTKNKAKFAKVGYTLQPIAPDVVWDGVLQKDSMWAYADQGSFKMRMREVYRDHGRFKKQAKELQGWIRENFSLHQQYKKCLYMLENFLLDEEEIDDFSFFEREN